MLEKSMAGTICDLVERIFHVEKIKFNNISPCVLVLTHANFLYEEEGRTMGQNWLWAKMINQCWPGCNGHSDSWSYIEFHVEKLTFHNFFISLLRRDTLHSVQIG